MLLTWLKHLNDRISPEELNRRMASSDKFLVLDVRRDIERQGPDGWIPGSINVPVSEFREKGVEIAERDDRPVITVCSHGLRSLYVLSPLKKRMPEREVLSLKGGMRAWNRKGFAVIKAEGADHAPQLSRKEC